MDMVTNILLQMTNTPKTTAASDASSPKTEDFAAMLVKKQSAETDVGEKAEVKAQTPEQSEDEIAGETTDAMREEVLSMANAIAAQNMAAAQNVIQFPIRAAAEEVPSEAETAVVAPMQNQMPMQAQTQSAQAVMAEMPTAVQTDAGVEADPVMQSVAQPTFAKVQYEAPSMEPRTEIVSEGPTGEAKAEGKAEAKTSAEVDSAVWQSVKSIRVVSAKAESGVADARSDGEADTEAGTQMSAAMAFKPLFRDAQATVIKVGDATVVDTASAEMDEQMAQTITTALANAEEAIEIRLAPESLGSVTILLKHTQNGALQVVMSAESERAQAILTKHAPNLQSLLMENGRENVQVEVHQPQNEQRQDLFEQQSRQQQNHQQNPRHSRQRSDDFLQQLRLGLVSLDAEAI